MNTIAQFIKDTKNESMWYAFTGKTFLESVKDGLYSLGNFIYEYSDVAILFILAFLLLSMCGSKRARKYMYWIGMGWIGIKFLGSAL